MKIILSRKGFDSTFGGIPSMVNSESKKISSFPIPDKSSSIKYSELLFDNKYNYFDIIKELGTKKLKESHRCHLDPDIQRDLLQRDPGWTGLFGQSNAAAGHLRKHQIDVDDLFLFYGWFQYVENRSGHYHYINRTYPNGFHLIYGYLQIAKVIDLQHGGIVEEWMSYHPHISSGITRPNNTLYVAAKHLSWDNQKNGFGIFQYIPELVLTKAGSKLRSLWELPSVFKGLTISYHDDDAWQDDYFKSRPRGQEFVIEENYHVTEWLKTLVDRAYGDK